MRPFRVLRLDVRLDVGEVPPARLHRAHAVGDPIAQPSDVTPVSTRRPLCGIGLVQRRLSTGPVPLGVRRLPVVNDWMRTVLCSAVMASFPSGIDGCAE